MPTFVTNTEPHHIKSMSLILLFNKRKLIHIGEKEKMFRITLVSNIQCRVCQSSWRYPITAAPFSIIIFKKNSFRSSFFLFAYIKVLSLPHTTIIQPYFCPTTESYYYFSLTIHHQSWLFSPWVLPQSLPRQPLLPARNLLSVSNYF